MVPYSDGLSNANVKGNSGLWSAKCLVAQSLRALGTVFPIAPSGKSSESQTGGGTHQGDARQFLRLSDRLVHSRICLAIAPARALIIESAASKIVRSKMITEEPGMPASTAA